MSTLARTLEAVDILQKHKFSKEEAQKVIDIMQGVSASKEDLLKTEIKLKEDLHILDRKIDSVRENILKTEVCIKEEIHKSSNNQIKWIFGMLFTVVVTILGLLKL